MRGSRRIEFKHLKDKPLVCMGQVLLKREFRTAQDVEGLVALDALVIDEIIKKSIL
jgi:hypothetical protein